jgi:pyruvate-ferredoxin/flavodoxin oxidoreductase
MGEVRYSQNLNTFPELAEKLYEKSEQDAKERYELYKKLSQL